MALWNWIIANPVKFLISLGIIIAVIIALCIAVKFVKWAIRK